MAMHKNHKGFERLRPKTKEDDDAEKVLRDFEAGKYGPPVKEEGKPKPSSKDPYEGLAPDEIVEMKRREKFRKALGGK